VPTSTEQSNTLATPLGKGGLVFAATDALLKRVVSGEFRDDPGSFPREADLIEKYEVSRTVIREALRILEEKGLIRIQQGRPTVALGVDSWNILDPLIVAAMLENDAHLDLFGQLFELRAAIEADLTLRATQSMTTEDKTRLGEALARLKAHVNDPDEYRRNDREFHDIIMDAAGNLYGKRLVKNIFRWTGRDVLAWASDNPLHEINLEQVKLSHAAHVRIFSLIMEGRAEDASREMRTHALTSWSGIRAEVLRQSGAAS
jgi:GntR family transcriptional regulator, galactonate operon transcriptional repressor